MASVGRAWRRRRPTRHRRQRPRRGLGAEGGAEERPQQELDRQGGRCGDHHRAQDMGLAGAEAAEEVGASVGEGAAQGQQQSDHGTYIPYSFNGTTRPYNQPTEGASIDDPAVHWTGLSTRRVDRWPRPRQPCGRSRTTSGRPVPAPGCPWTNSADVPSVSKGALVALERATGQPELRHAGPAGRHPRPLGLRPDGGAPRGARTRGVRRRHHAVVDGTARQRGPAHADDIGSGRHRGLALEAGAR